MWAPRDVVKLVLFLLSYSFFFFVCVCCFWICNRFDVRTKREPSDQCVNVNEYTKEIMWSTTESI